MLIKNKKGSEKLLSAWWFFVLAIIVIGITAGVFIFYNKDIDVREIEAMTLNNKLKNCLISGGVLVNGFFEEDFDIFNECNLKKQVIESGDFYLKINVLNDKEEVVKKMQAGKITFDKDCEISKSIEAEEFPKCVESKENVIYLQNGKQSLGEIYVLAASNQKTRKIS